MFDIYQKIYAVICRRVLLILNMQVVAPGSEVGEKIGSPTQLTDVSTNEVAASTSRSNITNGSTSKPETMPNTSSNGSLNVSMGSLNTSHVHPISSLSPYHNK